MDARRIDFMMSPPGVCPVERRATAANCCIPAGFGKIKFLPIGDLPKTVYALAPAERRTDFAASPVCDS
jgi:hypothetical protein